MLRSYQLFTFGLPCALVVAGCGGEPATTMSSSDPPGTGSETSSGSTSSSTATNSGETVAPTTSGGEPTTDDDTSAGPGGEHDMGQSDLGGGEEVEPPPECPGPPGPGKLPEGAVPGELSFPFPTLRNATVEWAIEGDADEDSVVTVRFREEGTRAWRKALPLRRIPADANEGFSWANRHSGSLFDLEPDTTYEVEAFLLDPDGGCELRYGTFTTRAVPGPMPGAPVKTATPNNFASIAASAEPGDIIELSPGTYSGFTFPRDGEPGKPIVLRAGGDVTINGEVSLISRKYVHLVGMKVNGNVRANLSVGVTITNNTITTQQHGIRAILRSENLYIADNRIIGSSPWTADALGVNGDNVGEGIWVTGPGHVIEHNLVRGFRDGISLNEDDEADDQFSIDIVNNDIYDCADDGIEADFCFHNCRVMQNRLTNTFIALSSQPGLGGPTYFIRNALYNVIHTAFKLQRGSVGDVVLHNTVVKNGDALSIYTDQPFARQYFRNNIFLGGPGGTYNGYFNGSGRVISLEAAAPSGDYDYDGFGSQTGKFEGRLGAAVFASLAELQMKTTEKHAVELDLGVFEAAVAYPASPFPGFEPVSLALAQGSAAEDVGVRLPNVNDGFTGEGPDLGAHERGAPAPVYGPR